MSNHTATPAQTEHDITDCATHGSKFSMDKASAVLYRSLAAAHLISGTFGVGADGVSSWACCDSMVVITPA